MTYNYPFFNEKNFKFGKQDLSATFQNARIEK